MLDTEKIKTQLNGMSGDQCAAFAVRTTMRMLPLLVAQKKQNFKAFWNKKTEAFDFWKPEDRAKYLLDIYMIYSCSIERILDNNSDITYI